MQAGLSLIDQYIVVRQVFSENDFSLFFHFIKFSLDTMQYALFLYFEDAKEAN